MQQIVDDVNRERSRYEQIKRFVILPRDFTVEDGEVTPTLKLKRNVVLEHFASQVDSIYALGPACRVAVGRRPRNRLKIRRAPNVAGEYQPDNAEIFTTSPVCGAWMNWPPPM